MLLVPSPEFFGEDIYLTGTGGNGLNRGLRQFRDLACRIDYALVSSGSDGSPNNAILPWNAISISSACSATSVFFRGRTRCAQPAAASDVAKSPSSVSRRSRSASEGWAAKSGFVGAGEFRARRRWTAGCGGGFAAGVLTGAAVGHRSQTIAEQPKEKFRGIQIVLSSNSDQRKKGVAPGIGERGSQSMRNRRLADRADRPVGGHPFPGGVGQHGREPDQAAVSSIEVVWTVAISWRPRLLRTRSSPLDSEA